MWKLILLFILGISIFSQDVNDILFITENYPPYNYIEDEKLTGMSVEILEEILKKMNSDLNRDKFKFYPWARGYMLIQTKDNVCLFTMTRNKERENLFNWIGPLASEETALYAKKSKNIKIENIQDLNNYKLGSVRDDISGIILKQNGIDDVYTTTYPKQLALMLELDRIDIWAYGKNVARKIIVENDINIDKYEIVYSFNHNGGNYFAFSKNVSQDLLAKFQSALDDLKEEGIYQDIVNKYMK